ncbi:MAG TPA: hypothetical protein VFA68_22145 [Terriglobales bacterium]|nr:hypothetical protein [Terriglobales bacterium]
MKRTPQLVLVVLALLAVPRAKAQTGLNDLLERTGKAVSVFVDRLSEVKCTEEVRQEKLGKEGKVELTENSTYDYLIILTNSGGDLSLDESRLAVKEARPDKKNRSMLVSNGFSTLFLIFHPYYSNSFQFAVEGDEVVEGRSLTRLSFQHIRGMRSPAALSIRGREYPLELSGTAYVDPQTGAVVRMTADVGETMTDVGLKTLRSEIVFAPVPFKDSKEVYWFPLQATVEVETPRQHWRNLHRFSQYKKFSVSTEEQVASK